MMPKLTTRSRRAAGGRRRTAARSQRSGAVAAREASGERARDDKIHEISLNSTKRAWRVVARWKTTTTRLALTAWLRRPAGFGSRHSVRASARRCTTLPPRLRRRRGRSAGCRTSPAPGERRTERDEERGGGERGGRRRPRMTCGAHVGTTILKLFFCVHLIRGGHAFYYFPSYNCHISATAIPRGTET